MSSAEQLALFPFGRMPKGESFPIASTPPEVLGPRTSLTAAIGAFHLHMRKQGFSENTIKAFGGDLNIFRKYVGVARPISEVSAKDITDFMQYLRNDRGVPCNMKSYQRRLTSLKVFFSFLYENQAIAQDPAAGVPHQPVITPLPDILNDGQVDRLSATTAKLMSQDKGDSRPHLLVKLLLSTGIKKSECMALRLDDIDLSHPEQPYVIIRYADPKRRHKERKLKVPADFQETYKSYLEEYHPRENLFECTSRNLEYVLADVAEAAGLNGKVSFEVLRWTCAVRDLKKGMREETLRQKLGLSTITWQEAGDKIRRLASTPL